MATYATWLLSQTQERQGPACFFLPCKSVGVDMVATVYEPLTGNKARLGFTQLSLQQLTAAPEGYGEIGVIEVMCWAQTGSQAIVVLMATMLSV